MKPIDLHKQAMIDLQADRLDEAFAICQQVLKLNPNFAPTYICLGSIYRKRQDLDAAIASIEKGLSLQPKLTNGYLILGEIYCEQQLFDLAIAAYENALKQQLVNSNIYYKLGEIYSRKQQFDQAYLNGVKALDVDPDPREAYFYRTLRLGFISLNSDNLFEQYITHYPHWLERLKPLIQYSSPITNIYHCSPSRAGSQWLKEILKDFRIFQYSGLAPFPVGLVKGLVKNQLSVHRFAYEATVIPRNTIVTGTLTIDFEQFQTLPKPEHYRAFFILRDPRDLVVSTYFANKQSHRVEGHILETRKVLNDLSLTNGLRYQLELESLLNVFRAMRSWVEKSHVDPAVMLVRFEDLTGERQFETFQALFQHCDIQIPAQVLEQLLAKNSFKQLSGGREQGQEDNNSHYRKGIHGDWQNYFNDEIHQRFTELTGDLVHLLGYSQLE